MSSKLLAHHSPTSPPQPLRMDPNHPKYQIVNNLDITYHNMNASSDFRTLRIGSNGSVEDVLLQVARHVENGCFKIVSISASKHWFVVVMSTELGTDELHARGCPWPSWAKKGEGAGNVGKKEQDEAGKEEEKEMNA
ncbi:uncharacterized protein PAC_16457 [Phialocephala subalpina]|uniref:Uncharacterized protein n=1 Tax=Phialocephala subalpina TaxID=576137 RepID=A0A1L7XNQ1_9HELO|nr:uncharacterized protein PAC_16457 [Phialocephala subalpina]